MNPTPLYVPRDWSPDEALRVAGFLEDVIAAIWAVHGEAMEHRQAEISHLLDVERPRRPPRKGDDEIPF